MQSQVCGRHALQQRHSAVELTTVHTLETDGVASVRPNLHLHLAYFQPGLHAPSFLREGIS